MTENVGVVFLFVIIKVKDIIKTFTYSLLVVFFFVCEGGDIIHTENLNQLNTYIPYFQNIL